MNISIFRKYTTSSLPFYIVPSPVPRSNEAHAFSILFFSSTVYVDKLSSLSSHYNAGRRRMSEIFLGMTENSIQKYE